MPQADDPAPEWLNNAQKNAKKKRKKQPSESSGPSSTSSQVTAVVSETLSIAPDSTKPANEHSLIIKRAKDTFKGKPGSELAGGTVKLSDNRQINDQRQYVQHNNTHHHHYHGSNTGTDTDTGAGTGHGTGENKRNSTLRQHESSKTSAPTAAPTQTQPAGPTAPGTGTGTGSGIHVLTSVVHAVFSTIWGPLFAVGIGIVLWYCVQFTVRHLVSQAMSGATSWVTSLPAKTWFHLRASLAPYLPTFDLGFSPSPSTAAPTATTTSLATAAAGIWAGIASLFSGHHHRPPPPPSSSSSGPFPTIFSIPIPTIHPSAIHHPFPDGPAIASALTELQARLHVTSARDALAVQYLRDFSPCLGEPGPAPLLDGAAESAGEMVALDVEIRANITAIILAETDALAALAVEVLAEPASAGLVVEGGRGGWWWSGVVVWEGLGRWVRDDVGYRWLGWGDAPEERTLLRGAQRVLEGRIDMLRGLVREGVAGREVLWSRLKSIASGKLRAMGTQTCRLAVCVEKAAVNAEGERQRRSRNDFGGGDDAGNNGGMVGWEGGATDVMTSKGMARVRDQLSFIAGNGRMICAAGDRIAPRVKYLLGLVEEDLDFLTSVGTKLDLLAARTAELGEWQKRQTGKDEREVMRLAANKVDTIEEEIVDIIKQWAGQFDNFVDE